MSPRERSKSSKSNQEVETIDVQPVVIEDEDLVVDPEAVVLDAEAEGSADDSDLDLDSPISSVPVSGAGGALQPADTLTAYMAELSAHEPISREEEHALAVRWVEDGDRDAARQLVLANLRLVVKIAMEYRRAWTNVLDLIQSGNVGLLEAVQRFDPYKGVKLTSYAVYWIRAYMLKYIMDNYRTVRLGRSRAQRKLFFRLNKEKRKLEREGFEVEPKLLAERLEVSEADVIDMDQRMNQGDLSLNAPARRDEPGAEYGDFIAGGGQSAEDSLGETELREVFLEKVHEFAAELDERDRRIIDERILADDQRTLQDLADEFGVSRERVRQLEARLINRMRDYLKDHLVDFDFYTVEPDA